MPLVPVADTLIVCLLTSPIKLVTLVTNGLNIFVTKSVKSLKYLNTFIPKNAINNMIPPQNNIVNQWVVKNILISFGNFSPNNVLPSSNTFFSEDSVSRAGDLATVDADCKVGIDGNLDSAELIDFSILDSKFEAEEGPLKAS